MGTHGKPTRRMASLPVGRAVGWIKTAYFGKGGTKGTPEEASVAVIVVNPRCDTSCSDDERLRLLHAVAGTVRVDQPTVILTAGGFLGYAAREQGRSDWVESVSADQRLCALEALTQPWPGGLMLAIGVDSGSANQQQWWLRGGEGRVAAIRRAASTLDDRRVAHGGLTFLGFVCGEAYAVADSELSEQFRRGVDVVAISAHVQVNRTWDPVLSPGAKRWAFQRMFQRIAGHAGASLAHARGVDDCYVRNCDNWFVHRGEPLFADDASGRVGRPVEGAAPPSS